MGTATIVGENAVVEPDRGGDVNGSSENGPVSATLLRLNKLDLDQVQRTDEMLDSIGEFGEVHLIVQHGELKYINRLESQKAGKRRGAPPRD